VRALLDLPQAQLVFLDGLAQPAERGRVLALGPHVLVEPVQVGLVARKVSMKSSAASRRRDADLHHGLLDAPDLVQVLAQLADQLVEHPRGELELHELVGELAAKLGRLGVAAALVVERLERLAVELRERGETTGRFLRIRAGIDGFLFLAASLSSSSSEASLAAAASFGLIGSAITSARWVDEADDDVGEAPLAALQRLVGAQDELVVGG